MAPVQTGEIIGVTGDDLQEVVGCSRHEMAFEHFRNPGDGLFEGVENLVGLTAERDLDKHGCGPGDLARIDKGDIAANPALLLKSLHAPVAGGRGEVDLFGKLRIRQPAITLERGKQPPVCIIDLRHAR